MNNNIDLVDQNVQYRSEASIKNIGAIWGVPLKMTPPYNEAGGKVKSLATLSQTPPTTLATLLQNTPVSKWEQAIKETAEQQNPHQFIQAGYDDARRVLKANMDRELNSPTTYDHILSQLNVDEVAEEFKRSVLTLGNRVFNIHSAIDFDANAVATFRSSGRKLLVLQNLNTRNGVQYFTSSLYANVSELPTLVSEGGQHQWTQQDADRHQAVASTKTGVKDRGTLLVELALGRKPGISLDVATTWDELQARNEVFQDAGRVQKLPGNASPNYAEARRAIVW